VTKRSDITKMLKDDEDARQRRVARDAVHSLRGKRAAARILMGACLTGDIDKEKAVKAFVQMGGDAERVHELAPRKRRDNTLQWSKSTAGVKILFVDDEYESAGWKVVLDSLFGEESTLYASSKDKALKSIDNDGKVAVVLLDLKLPSEPEEGIEALVDIKNVRPDMPVVMFTGEDTIKYQRKCFKEGCFDYFVKEFEEEEKDYVRYYETFREIIESSLGHSRQSALWRQVILFEKQVRTEGPPYFEQEFHYLRKACYFLTDGENDWKAQIMLSQHGITR
jgi:CheY-like chemotaxis protein